MTPSTEGNELGDQTYVVLVMVALRGPSTAYDIERALDPLTGEFWSVPHTQIYRECERLVDAGLLKGKQEASGRRRRTYTLTASGKREVEAWVRTPTDRSMEIRDISQFKLMATEYSTKEDVRRLAEAQVENYRRRLEILERIEERFADDRYALRTQNIAMGRAIYEAALKFWTNIAENPPKPKKQP